MELKKPAMVEATKKTQQQLEMLVEESCQDEINTQGERYADKVDPAQLENVAMVEAAKDVQQPTVPEVTMCSNYVVMDVNKVDAARLMELEKAAMVEDIRNAYCTAADSA